MLHRMFFLGRYFVFGLLCTLEPKIFCKNLVFSGVGTINFIKFTKKRHMLGMSSYTGQNKQGRQNQGMTHFV